MVSAASDHMIWIDRTGNLKLLYNMFKTFWIVRKQFHRALQLFRILCPCVCGGIEFVPEFGIWLIEIGLTQAGLLPETMKGFEASNASAENANRSAVCFLTQQDDLECKMSCRLLCPANTGQLRATDLSQRVLYVLQLLDVRESVEIEVCAKGKER